MFIYLLAIVQSMVYSLAVLSVHLFVCQCCHSELYHYVAGSALLQSWCCSWTPTKVCICGLCKMPTSKFFTAWEPHDSSCFHTKHCGKFVIKLCSGSSTCLAAIEQNICLLWPVPVIWPKYDIQPSVHIIYSVYIYIFHSVFIACMWFLLVLHSVVNFSLDCYMIWNIVDCYVQAFAPNLRYILSVGTEHDMMVNVWNWRNGIKVASNKVSSKVQLKDININFQFMTLQFDWVTMCDTCVACSVVILKKVVVKVWLLLWLW